jgi:hypothetical protein
MADRNRVQEAVLARHLVLHYGALSVDVAKLAFLQEQHTEQPLATQLSELMVIDPTWGILDRLQSTIFQDFSKSFSNILNLSRLSTFLQRWSTADPKQKAWALVDLFGNSRAKSTFDPRDRVYGLLGVCNALFGDLLKVDYSNSVEHVYEGFAMRLIETSGSLVILTQASRIPRTGLKLKSWIPDWSSTYDHKLEWLRLHQWNHYNAAGSALLPRSMPTGYLIVDAILFDINAVDECVVRRVDQIPAALTKWWTFTDRQLGFGASSEPPWAMKLGSWNPWPSELGPEYAQLVHVFIKAVLRGLMMNEGPGEPKFRDVDAAFKVLDYLKDISGRQKLPPPDKFDSASKQCLHSLYIGMASSKLLICRQSHGHPKPKLGVACADVQPGDSIAILPGANVPFAIRRASVSEARYLVIGPAYVSGVMSGQYADTTRREAWRSIRLI